MRRGPQIVGIASVLADVIILITFIIKMTESTQRGRRWVFTWNNYPEDYQQFFVSKCDELDIEVVHVVMGEEVAPTTGTKHLQCYLHVKQRLRRPSNLFQLGSNWELCRNPALAILYCKKGEQPHEEWTTHKATGPNYGQNAVVFEINNGALQGKRNDLKEFKKAVDDANGTYTYNQALVDHSVVVAKYRKFVIDYVQLRKPKKQVAYHPLRPWQADLNHMLNLPPDERKITFVVDHEGNKGKSWFAFYYHMNHDRVQLLPPDKFLNMAYLVDTNTRVFFIDLPREKTEFFPYSFLEQLKNGHLFSTKYEPIEKSFDTPHVCVMTNVDPDRAKLSQDRYHIVNI